MKGTGGVKLGELANKEGITIAGANYSGRLDTGNIYAGPGPLSITTKGAITTGNLTGNNITIDLSKNITTTEGQYNNNIGTIYVERVDATNSSGTLTYTTGISGTQGVETTNADGTTNPNDTQNIVVNTSSATLNINGAGGVDKFNIEASSFTKTLTISGNLGTVPNYEEAKNNYDSVRIDLSKTSGVDLNISNLLVSNPNDEGIVITASKGADNITLVAGANHDVIEFTAGGGTSASTESYQFDFGNARLSYNQSITIDGVTITNIKAGSVLLATDIANAFAEYANGGYALGTASTTKFSGSTSLSGTGIVTYVSMTGKFESLTNDWLTASGKPTATFSGGDSFFTLTSKANANL
ncbi:MAG: hypothetical protein K2N20_00695, partial [Helicobacter sp.]|nr:hypothetical protein [Helicobacter sp.]